MATLAQLAQAYLNQGLPDISGIFQPGANTPVVETPVEETTPGITPLLLQQTGGGGGGGPFNINPNDPNVRTSDQYSPYAYRQAAEKNLIGDSYSSGTQAQKLMDNYPDYYEGPQLTGIPGLISNYVKASPLMRLAGKGLDALGNMLPPSRTGILQNELLGGGFMLDNTGRIVTNNYNTPEGIMAGYNPVSGGLLNLVTGGKMGEETNYGLDKSYDKRRETISKTLKDKYNMSDEDIEAALAGEYEGNVETDLIERLDLLNKSQNLFNKRKSRADTIFKTKVEERQNQARIARETKQKAEAARKNQTYTGGSDRQNIIDKNTGRRDATGGDAGSKGAADRFENKSGRGRTGY